MKVLEVRPHRAGGKTIARFDAELDQGVKAYDLKLVQGDSGLRVYGPALHGGAAVTFPSAVASQLAILALEAIAHHGHHPLRCA